MINKGTTIRVARPTDNLNSIADMYQKGLGFNVLAKFEDHDGFDGIVLGFPGESYHIEFTHHKGTTVGHAPTRDNLLVFYIEKSDQWKQACLQAKSAGFKEVESYNPYWDVLGSTYEDIDGYRVVLQNGAWSD
ncbi:MAG: glyoxalase [Moraxellaceae bacterium]|nr:MAG: glyoxalase [Moraxellaceae bacterium]